MARLKQNTELQHSDAQKRVEKEMDKTITFAAELRTDLEEVLARLDEVIAGFTARQAA